MTNLEKLRETFPKTIFIFQKNGNDETTGIMCSNEWLQGDYNQMYKDSEPCEDAVSRKDIGECIELMTDINGKTIYAVRMSDIRKLPPVTPKPKTGKWAKTGQSYINPNRFRNYCCSECGWELDEHIRIEPHYCPNCGAKMEGVSK